MEAALIALAVVLGLAAGSFANVPVARWPQGRSVGEPSRSQCPSCGTPLAARDNIPLISYVILRGRCRHCSARIAPRYPLIELLVAALFGVTTAVWGLDARLPALLVFVWALVVASAIDLEHRIIPNRLTLRLPLVLAPLLLVAWLVDRDTAALARAGIWAIALPAIMFALSEVFRLLRGQAGIGLGDVKFAISIGLVVGHLGGWHLVVFAYASVAVAVAVALVLLILRKARLASRIPFGPYLAVGALVPVLAGDASTSFVRGVLGL